MCTFGGQRGCWVSVCVGDAEQVLVFCSVVAISLYYSVKWIHLFRNLPQSQLVYVFDH